MADSPHQARSFDIAAIAVWEFDIESGRHWWSAELYRLLGYRPDEIAPAAEVLYAVVHPDDHAQVREVFDGAAAGQNPRFVLEIRLRHRSGDWRWVENHVQLRTGSDGRQSLIGYLIDVEERRQQERLLRFTQYTMDKNLDITLWLDEEGRFVYVNEAYCRLLGYSRAELLTMDHFQINPNFHPDSWARNITFMKGRGSDFIRTSQVTKDDRVIQLELAVNLFELDGVVVMCCQGRDIGERMAYQRRIEDDERRYRALWDMLPIPLFVTGLKNGVLLDLNPRAEEVFGIPRAQALGQSTAGYYQEPGLRERYAAEMELNGAVDGWEIAFKSAKGGATWATLHGRLAEIEGETVMISALNDITARKRLEEELRAMAATDSLTNVNNRRAFIEKADSEVGRARRYGHPLAVAMLDLDHFKRINDGFGHKGGDDALKAMVAALKLKLRGIDILGRLGGEEFALALPETAIAAARMVCDRLRETVANLTVPSDAGPIRFTVSIGLAENRAEDRSIDTILSRADRALYAAKAAGRNRVVVFGDELSVPPGADAAGAAPTPSA